MKIETLHALVERADEVVILLNETAEAIQDTGNNSQAVNSIIQLVSAQLIVPWNDLAPRVTNRDNWLGITQTVNELQELSSSLKKIVLQPHRTHVEKTIQTWLGLWKLSSNALVEFLADAEDIELDTLLQLTDEIMQITISDAGVHQKTERWLTDQVTHLDRLLRKPTQLIAWTQQAEQTIKEAGALSSQLHAIQEVIDNLTDDIVQSLASTWFKNYRKSIDTIKIEQPRPGFGDRGKEITERWQSLQRSFDPLTLQLKSLDTRERRLVLREVKSWKSIDSSEISNLLSRIQQLLRLRQAVTNVPALADGGNKPIRSASQDIRDLYKNCPRFQPPREGDTLLLYTRSLEKLQEKIAVWQEEFERIGSDLFAQFGLWQRLATRLSSQQRANCGLDNGWGDLHTLGDIIAAQGRLVSIQKCVREVLSANLAEGERQLLDILLDHLDSEEEVDLATLSMRLTSPIEFRHLNQLAEKQIIRITISIS